MRLDEQYECHYFRDGVYLGEVQGLVVGIIQGIAKVEPRRALDLAEKSGLQRLTYISLDEVVLWQLQSYEEVKEAARGLNFPEWRYAYTLRAAHDLAGAYAAWKEKDGDVDELKTMLMHARADEGALILKLLREEVLPRIAPAQHPTDTTALEVEIARAVASVKPQAARRMLDAIAFGPRDYDSRRDLAGVLPTLALAKDPERALNLPWHLDKDSAGFGAIVISEIARLSALGLVQFENDISLRFQFRSALEDIKESRLTPGDVSTIFSGPWAWANARVAGSIGRRFTPREFDWRPRHTLAVVIGKASAFWPEIREELNQHWTNPEDRELALCEATQWMPVDEWPMVEDIQKPALAAIAWSRMALRTTSARERDEWNRRVRDACESWPGPEDGEALDILWVFAYEMGVRNDVCRRLAGRILDHCHPEDSLGCAPWLLAVVETGAFDKEQQKRVEKLGFGWQDWLHTFKFATNISYNDGQYLAAKHLTQLANAWWPIDSANARACLEQAVDHAREMTAGPTRSNVQTQCLQSWVNYGEAADWKRALAHWRWGAAFLKAADAFVARWAARNDTGYPELQKKAIDWGQGVAGTLLKAR